MRKVRTLAAENGTARWDRTNNAGDPVASGVYLFVAKDPAGREFRGKLALIR